jgi:hypothetical protein
MEEKHVILIGALVLYTLIVFLFARLGRRREIGFRRLFLISFFLTPIMGLAFYLSSAERKLNTYTEESFKCERCGYVFYEEQDHCPFCEKENQHVKLVRVNKLMT